MSLTLRRGNGDYHLIGTNETGASIQFDVDESHGGNNEGVGPMQSVAMAIGACSMVDLVDILRKQKQEIEDVQISIDTEREAESYPRVFRKVHLKYTLVGDLNPDKVKRAIDLSLEKYCSVAGMVGKTAEITYDYEVVESIAV